jgi:hypothetical protein
MVWHCPLGYVCLSKVRVEATRVRVPTMGMPFNAGSEDGREGGKLSL